MKNRTPRARHIALPCLRPCVLAVLSLVSAQVAHAQSFAEPVLLAQNARMPSLQDTVVTATRTEQPLADLVADVSIVDRETIESSGATGLADVLARLPGIEISRNGGVGNA
ncbi:MAG TPA: TonB-dependent receptor, partial [Acidovorax sp.]|nr:TonB-dependent receptor [Acidovorax sp.]